MEFDTNIRPDDYAKVVAAIEANELWGVALHNENGRGVVLVARASSAEEATSQAMRGLENSGVCGEDPLQVVLVEHFTASGYKPEFIADASGKWCGNALVFATVSEAQQYNTDLMSRWMLVREMRVVAVFDAEPTHFWKDGKLGHIGDPSSARVPARNVQL